MDFADIVFGIVGFIVMFFAFSIVRGVYHGILNFIRKKRERGESLLLRGCVSDHKNGCGMYDKHALGNQSVVEPKEEL